MKATAQEHEVDYIQLIGHNWEAVGEWLEYHGIEECDIDDLVDTMSGESSNPVQSGYAFHDGSLYLLYNEAMYSTAETDVIATSPAGGVRIFSSDEFFTLYEPAEPVMPPVGTVVKGNLGSEKGLFFVIDYGDDGRVVARSMNYDDTTFEWDSIADPVAVTFVEAVRR